MWLRRLDIDGVRNLRKVKLSLPEGVIGFFGDNGAGKTSILESVFCLSSGRSFRSGQRSDFISRDMEQATLFAEVVEGERCHKLGLARSARHWQGRLDGENLDTLESLARSLAVQVFHPRLHQLIEGAPDERRRFLDFGVFHVEPTYFGHWRDYRRALKQRNAALRQGAPERDIRVWDAALLAEAEAVNQLRRQVCDELKQHFGSLMSQLAPELGALTLTLHSGWRAEESLSSVLARTLDRDRAQAHTGAGPHRADLKIAGADGPVAGILSRGQQKTVVLALTLAMQSLVASPAGRQPVLCIDDFSSELDAGHQLAVLSMVRNTGAQVLLTGTEQPAVLTEEAGLTALFHVEQGQANRVL